MAEEELQQLAINTIRTLSMDAVQKANSGHPGAPMGMAPMAYALWTRFLKHNPTDPRWPDRDRFLLSAGHASMLLYSLLYLTGYGLTIEDLQSFRQFGSRTPGHPEYGHTAGVEATTGPLGQGFAMGVGMAIAERELAARFNRPGHTLVDHYTYVICSDGDLMEGVASEAASLAGTQGWARWSSSTTTTASASRATTDLAFREDVGKRFEAYGWHVQHVADGNDVATITSCIEAARAETARPSLIVVATHIAYGSPHKQDSETAHGNPLGVEEVALTKRALGWPEDKTSTCPASRWRTSARPWPMAPPSRPNGSSASPPTSATSPPRPPPGAPPCKTSCPTAGTATCPPIRRTTSLWPHASHPARRSTPSRRRCPR